MCGRFYVDKQQIDEWVLDNFDVDFSTATNLDLRPTQTVATIANVHGDRVQLDTSWGIKPGWSKKLLINAQGETVASKKTFKQSFNERRCLIPCSGWYEWRDEGGNKKTKYLFSNVEKSPFLMAGIWFETKEMPQLVTLTTTPNKRCAEIHKRMPVIIRPENIDYWFNSSTLELQPLMEAIGSDEVNINSC